LQTFIGIKVAVAGCAGSTHRCSLGPQPKHGGTWPARAGAPKPPKQGDLLGGLQPRPSAAGARSIRRQQNSCPLPTRGPHGTWDAGDGRGAASFGWKKLEAPRPTGEASCPGAARSRGAGAQVGCGSPSYPRAPVSIPERAQRCRAAEQCSG